MKELLATAAMAAAYFLLMGLGFNTDQSACPDWTGFHTNRQLTPNGDNIDEEWRITYNLYCWEDVEFWIYNSEGEVVYHNVGDSFDLYPFWDGTIMGEYVPNGEYSYLIKAIKTDTGELREKKGSFRMIKK